MDGLSILIMIFIYAFAGLTMIGLLFLLVGFINKNNSQILDGIKALAIPIGLIFSYILYKIIVILIHLFH